MLRSIMFLEMYFSNMITAMTQTQTNFLKVKHTQTKQEPIRQRLKR